MIKRYKFLLEKKSLKVGRKLKGDLIILEVLEFLQVKFYLISGLNLDTPDTSIPIQTRPNAFRILIENSS